MKHLLLTFVALAMSLSLAAQDKVLTMEEAILGYDLYPKNLHTQWKGDQNCYSFIENKQLKAKDVQTDEAICLMTLDELNQILKADLKRWPRYAWKDAKTLLVFDQSTLIEYNISEINITDKKLIRQIKLPTEAANLQSNGNHPQTEGLWAYTKANNLYYMDRNGNEFAITHDTDPNIINGQTVSRNEFGIDGGIFWAPDGKKIAYYRKDESQVSTFPLLDIGSRTGTLREIKYPMTGMKSEQISLGVYDIASQKTIFLQVDDFGREQYLTNIAWGPQSQYIYIQVLDRQQKHMHLNKYDAQTGAFVKTLLTEQNDKYVEPLTPVLFLKSNPQKMIYRTNNRDGYFNLYVVDAISGKVEKRLTDVDADVEYIGQDLRSVYYTSSQVSPIENHLFRVDLKTGKKTRLTTEEGWHRISMSHDAQYFIDSYSALTVPRVINLKRNNGEQIATLLQAENPTKDYNFGEISLGTVRSADGAYDNYYRLIKPMNFDPKKKYPTIVYVYGGPHSQLVKNTWLGELRRWEMYMAQHGYVVFVMDNRGTLNRGQAFEQAIHGQCGQAEMADQIQGVKFLQSLPYVDSERIGVHGWSYGGFMTISLQTNYPDVFKVAVAGGPVIDWKWYEIMYGERYMDSPHTNQEGYERVSLIHKAKDLKGKLLICQGAIDNTVVWEHSLSFIRQCIINNVQVDYFPYPCAEHNVHGKDRIHLMQKVTNYFEDYLK